MSDFGGRTHGRRHSTDAIMSNSHEHEQGRQRPAGEEGWEAFAASAIPTGRGPYPPHTLAVMGAFAQRCAARRAFLLWSGEA